MSLTICQSIFLHGLESSSKGTKARFFSEHFPEMLIPDFYGNIDMRMDQLNTVTQKHETLVFVGSSFGGLMATKFAIDQPGKTKKLILLSPALNFPEFVSPTNLIDIKTTIFQGLHDTICPHNEIQTVAKSTFATVTFNSVEDDHMLHATFRSLPWHDLLV